MARIASAKSRRYRFVVDQPLAPGETPDTLALYLPDGTPIDLTADPSKMRWLGEWSDQVEYVTNDVVMYANQLYIIGEEDVVVAAGSDVPSLNADWFLLTVPVTTPPPGMRWEGPWSSGPAYEENAVVFHENALWYAPGDINAGLEPGAVLNDPTVFTARGVPMTQSMRISNEELKLLSIGPPPGRRDQPNYMFGSDYAYGLLFDSNGSSLNGVEITLIPEGAVVAGKYMKINFYTPGDSFQGSLTWTDAEVAARTPKTWVIASGSSDLAGFVEYYTNGSAAGSRVDGDFSVQVSDNTNLVASPFTGAEWIKLLDASPELPSGGAAGDRLVKNSATDGDVGWIKPVTIDTRVNRIAATPTAGRIWKESDTGVIYLGNGASWDILNPLGQLRKTSDFTLPQSDDVFDAANNVPQLSWPVGANEIWEVEAVLQIEGLSNVPDIKFDFSLPASATYKLASLVMMANVGGTGGNPGVVVVDTPLQVGAVAGVIFLKFTALLEIAGTAGTAQLRAAQVTSTAEDVKILTNSLLKPRRIL